VKIIRVLVYEGRDPETLKGHLQRRGVKKRSPTTFDRGEIVITEAFVDQANVDAWLGEQVDEGDMLEAVATLA